MNAVETIQAAIMRLEELRDNSTMGTWRADGFTVRNNSDEWVIGDASYVDDPVLIVTLHRTIDSQMAILLAALQASDVESNWDTLVYTEVALNLANAILGGAE